VKFTNITTNSPANVNDPM